MGITSRTMFETGPTDGVIAVDVYGEVVETPVNSTPVNLSPGTKKAIEILNKLHSKELFKVPEMSKITKGISTAKDALGRVKEITGGARSNAGGIAGKLLTKLLESGGYVDQPEAVAFGLLGVPGAKKPGSILLEQFPIVKIVTDQVTEIRKVTSDLNSITGIVSLINSVTGSEDFVKMYDLNAQSEVFIKLAQEAMEYRIPQLIDSLIDSHTTIGDKAVFLRYIVGDAAGKSNLDVIRRTLQYSNGPDLLAHDPYIINKILSGYRHIEGYGYPTVEHAEGLIELIESINPFWNYYSRGGVSIVNLDPYSVVNKAASEALSLLDLHRTYVKVAKLYPKQSLMAMFKKQYPLTPLTA